MRGTGSPGDWRSISEVGEEQSAANEASRSTLGLVMEGGRRSANNTEETGISVERGILTRHQHLHPSRTKYQNQETRAEQPYQLQLSSQYRKHSCANGAAITVEGGGGSTNALQRGIVRTSNIVITITYSTAQRGKTHSPVSRNIEHQ